MTTGEEEGGKVVVRIHLQLTGERASLARIGQETITATARAGQ